MLVVAAAVVVIITTAVTVAVGGRRQFEVRLETEPILNVTRGEQTSCVFSSEVREVDKGLKHRDPRCGKRAQGDILVVRILLDQTVVLMDSLCPNLSEKACSKGE